MKNYQILLVYVQAALLLLLLVADGQHGSRHGKTSKRLQIQADGEEQG